MRVRVEFEIDPRSSEDLPPGDFAHATDMADLEDMVMDYFEPNWRWRMSVNKSDLESLWKEVQKLQAEEK
jgi:hypothetical protein